MFCPSHQLLVNKSVTDFGRSKRPPPLHQVVSKPSGGTLATTVTAAREWSMGVRPGVETGQMRSPPKKHRKRLWRQVPLPASTKNTQLIQVGGSMIYDSADVFLLGIDLTLGVVLAKTTISTLPPGKRTAQIYLLTSLDFIPKTAPRNGRNE